MAAIADDRALNPRSKVGEALTEAQGEVTGGAAFLHRLDEEARRLYGESVSRDQQEKRSEFLKQPIGVATSLAAACAFVVRRPALTPMSALALAELGERAGLVPKIFNIVTSRNLAEFGVETCKLAAVRKLRSTGPTQVGQNLMAQAAPQIIKLSFLLGSKAPVVARRHGRACAGSVRRRAGRGRNNSLSRQCCGRPRAEMLLPTLLFAAMRKFHLQRTMWPAANVLRFAAEDEAIIVASDTEARSAPFSTLATGRAYTG